MKTTNRSIIEDFFHLIYPETCISCGNALFKHETDICNSCVEKLPLTGFKPGQSNAVSQAFEGRIKLVEAGSWLYFSKKNVTQKILHEIKYRDNYALAKWCGREMARYFLQQNGTLPDMLLPVPLHPAKLKKRGYNQSSRIAEGFSEELNVPISESILKRTRDLSSQTKKNRQLRNESIESLFAINENPNPEAKHILIIDDVITTGATLEAVCLPLKNFAQIKISVFTLAYARRY